MKKIKDLTPEDEHLVRADIALVMVNRDLTLGAMLYMLAETQKEYVRAMEKYDD